MLLDKGGFVDTGLKLRSLQTPLLRLLRLRPHSLSSQSGCLYGPEVSFDIVEALGTEGLFHHS